MYGNDQAKCDFRIHFQHWDYSLRHLPTLYADQHPVELCIFYGTKNIYLLCNCAWWYASHSAVTVITVWC